MEEKAQKTKKIERRGQREKQVVDGETTTAREEVATAAESVSVDLSSHTVLRPPKGEQVSDHKPTCDVHVSLINCSQ